jgi:hypothetical protein
MTAFASVGFGDGFGEGQLPWVDRSFAQKATAVSFGSAAPVRLIELRMYRLHRMSIRIARS